jgi:hypothetical protein
LDARLVCTMTLPCPAEMSASIHINGTQSSVVDSIFVCRGTGTVRASLVKVDQAGLKEILKADLERLRDGGVKPTAGDARCVLFGHLARLAVWQLRPTWDSAVAIERKLERAKAAMQQPLSLDLAAKVAAQVVSALSDVDLLAHMRVQEKQDSYASDEIPF